ncbi:hypothetical protein R3P38DRAFT_3240066 [Favolaschia claudopus]|uniref:Uncharacterized protein n=1 Tax=Favolaschia claudopus TaxID=2862362 RepID=A0AAV9Z7G6_9AGAR
MKGLDIPALPPPPPRQKRPAPTSQSLSGPVASSTRPPALPITPSSPPNAGNSRKRSSTSRDLSAAEAPPPATRVSLNASSPALYAPSHTIPSPSSFHGSQIARPQLSVNSEVYEANFQTISPAVHSGLESNFAAGQVSDSPIYGAIYQAGASLDFDCLSDLGGADNWQKEPITPYQLLALAPINKTVSPFNRRGYTITYDSTL